MTAAGISVSTMDDPGEGCDRSVAHAESDLGCTYPL
jgi:hypothetical protein